MPIASLLMVAHNTISNLNNSENDFSKELRPLDFTMSKFKSSSTGASKQHPLSQYFDAAHQSSSSNRDAGKEEQGECIKWILLFSALFEVYQIWVPDINYQIGNMISHHMCELAKQLKYDSPIRIISSCI